MCAVIDVAAECLALSNFNALMAILSALFSGTIVAGGDCVVANRGSGS